MHNFFKRPAKGKRASHKVLVNYLPDGKCVLEYCGHQESEVWELKGDSPFDVLSQLLAKTPEGRPAPPPLPPGPKGEEEK